MSGHPFHHVICDGKLLVCFSRINGFWSNCLGAVGVIWEAAKYNLTPAVKFDHGTYFDPDRDPNWWLNYFLPISDADVSGWGRTGYAMHMAHYFSRVGAYLSPQEAHDAIQGKIVVRPEILAQVDAFCAAENIGPGTVGLVYRGTDMLVWHGGRIISPRDMKPYVDAELKRFDGSLFVSSCEQEFVTEMRRLYPRVKYRDCLRAGPDRRNPHFDPALQHLAYKRGEDVLIDTLILSCCGSLIHNETGIATAAKIFNPTLAVRGENLSKIERLNRQRTPKDLVRRLQHFEDTGEKKE